MKRFLMENVKYFLLFFIIIFLTFLFGCYGVTPHAHTITSTAGAGGSISPEGATTVTEGDNQIFIITPDEGFLIENVLVDGLSTGAVATYTFQNVQQDHTIQASFVGLKVYNIDTGINYDTI